MAPSRTHKPRREYNSTLNKLQAHLEHQQQLLVQGREEAGAELKAHEILADGYCQQVVLYDLVIPMQKQWLSEGPSAAQASIHHQQHGSSSQVVQLVDNCNTMLRLLLRATPQQTREAAALTRDKLVPIHRELIMELLLQLELVCPQRYHGEEVPALTAATGSTAAAAASSRRAAAGAGAAVAVAKGHDCSVLAEQLLEGLPGSCSTDLAALDQEAQVAAAKAAAEARLEQLVHESLTMGLLLVLHNPPLLHEMCSLNLATNQVCVPPLGHFIRVTERLGLTQEQMTHLRLMLRHYNRGMQQQLQQGLELLKVSEDTAGAAQQLIERFDSSDKGNRSGKTAPGTGRSTAGSSQHPCSPTGDGKGRLGSCQGDRSVQESTEGNSESVSAGLAGVELSDRLDQHLSDRMRLMQLMGFWVTNTLSSRQVAKFFVHSWPYYPVCSAIAEASALLRPIEQPDNDPDAADTHAFMARRCRGMRAEFEWVMQHAPELAGQAHLSPAGTA